LSTDELADKKSLLQSGRGPSGPGDLLCKLGLAIVIFVFQRGVLVEPFFNVPVILFQNLDGVRGWREPRRPDLKLASKVDFLLAARPALVFALVAIINP
jgi:hypothetical protein